MLVALIIMWMFLLMADCRNCKYLTFAPLGIPSVSLGMWGADPQPLTFSYAADLVTMASLGYTILVVGWIAVGRVRLVLGRWLRRGRPNPPSAKTVAVLLTEDEAKALETILEKTRALS